MLPEAYICHHTAHRMRIKIPSKKGDALYFSLLQERISQYEGVERVEVNPVTGSVLLFHKLDATRLAELGAVGRLLSLTLSHTPAEPLYQKVVHTFDDFNKHLRAFTGNEMDIPSIAFVALLGLGIYQISRGNFIAPAWYTAFWYAASIVMSAHTGKGARGE